MMWTQVFRTEHHSRRLPEKSSLQLMSVLLFTIAAISIGAAGLKHPSEVAAFAGNPSAFLAGVHPASLPWKQILYTGLLSTDVALWLEVCLQCELHSSMRCGRSSLDVCLPGNIECHCPFFEHMPSYCCAHPFHLFDRCISFPR